MCKNQTVRIIKHSFKQWAHQVKTACQFVEFPPASKVRQRLATRTHRKPLPEVLAFGCARLGQLASIILHLWHEQPFKTGHNTFIGLKLAASDIPMQGSGTVQRSAHGCSLWSMPAVAERLLPEALSDILLQKC